MTRAARLSVAGIACAILAAPFISAASTCPTLTRTLARNSEGTDVRQLQQFLAERGYLSTSLIIGIYGLKTENAVKVFQAEQGIVNSGTPATTGYGAVGGRTRAKIAAVCTTTPRSGAGIPIPSTSTASYSSVNIVIPQNTQQPSNRNQLIPPKPDAPRIDIASTSADVVLINFYGMPRQTLIFMIDPTTGKRIEMGGYSPLEQGGNGYVTYPMLGEFAGNSYAFLAQSSTTKTDIVTSKVFTVPKPPVAGVGQAEVGLLQIFDGEVLLFSFNGITRSNADSRCKTEKAAYPARNTRCTFNGYQMFVQ